MNSLDKEFVECPECKNLMDEIKSINFNENGETYFYCKNCKISVST